MGAGFDDLKPLRGTWSSGRVPGGAQQAAACTVLARFSAHIHTLKPFGELPGEQLAEQRPDRGAGVKVATAADYVRFLFIVPINGTIKSPLHEVVEGDCPPGFDFGTDFFNEFLHWTKDGADLAT
jgi:hypothetical protein